MKTLKNLLLLLAFMPFFFSSCVEDDVVTEVTYSMGFQKVQSQDLGTELALIEDAFKSAIGVTDNLFKLQGDVKECDAKVLAACAEAEKTLTGRIENGTYLFEITNVVSGKVIYSKEFKPVE